MSLKDKIKKWWASLWKNTPLENNGSTSNGPVSTNLPAIKVGATLTGYGPVNMYWRMANELLTMIIARMQLKNVRMFVVEALGNAGEDVLGDEAKMARVKAKLTHCAGECERRGLYFNIITANDNAGKNNYSNGGIKLEKREPQCRAFIDWLASQPWQKFCIPTLMAEPQTDAGRRLQLYAAKKFKAAQYRIMHNQGDRPQSNEIIGGIKTDFFSYHNTSIADWPKSAEGIVLSDTGAAIRQLNLNNDLNGKGNPAAIAAWVAAGKARGQAGVCFYAFQVTEYDEQAIDSLSAGEVVSNPSELPPPTDPNELIPAQVKWLGTNYSAAKQTVKLSDISMSGTHLNFKASAIKWPPQGAKKCKAVGFLIRMIGNEFIGGKVEWCVVERGWYDIVTNTKTGYNGSTLPANGELCWAGLGHPTNGSECSSIVPFVWKG